MVLSSLGTVEWDILYEKTVGQPRSLKAWSLSVPSFPRPASGPLCVRVWEHHRVPGAESQGPLPSSLTDVRLLFCSRPLAGCQ